MEKLCCLVLTLLLCLTLFACNKEAVNKPPTVVQPVKETSVAPQTPQYTLAELEAGVIEPCNGLPLAGAEKIAVAIINKENDNGAILVGIKGESIVWQRRFPLPEEINTAKTVVNCQGETIELYSQLPYLTAGTSYRFSWNGKELRYLSKKEEDDPTVKDLEASIKAAVNGDSKALDIDILYPQQYISGDLISSTIKRGHRVATELYKEGKALEAATRLSLIFDLTAHFAYLATGNNNVQEESFARPEGWLIAWQALQVETKNYLTPFNDYGFFLQEAAEHVQAVKVFRLVIKESPKRDVAYLNLADSLWALNEQPEAQRHYQTYAKLMLAAGKQDKIPARVKERVASQ